ncbi:hypothetical protein [Novosphingobium sp.]|uniref:hypothetical protein n=1 Tax=Novosphingobium sp. TaxID=1874826 RepID=UPI0031D50B3E
MSDTYGSLISVSASDWVDLAAQYPAMAGVQSWVQNKGSLPILVFYTASASKPTADVGVEVEGSGGLWGGNAAHCWVKAVQGNGSVVVGLS